MKNKLYPKKFFVAMAVCITTGNLLLAQAPTITSFSPAAGSPGKSITLTGSNFNTTAGSNVVYFGATKATVTSSSATQLVVTVPVGATSKPITVLNGGSGLSAASRRPFIVTNAPYTGQDFTAGSFTAAAAYNQTILFRGIAVADFDGDGKADIAGYSNSPSVVVSVVRNTSSVSTISFAARQDFALPAGASSRLLTTGDVDNDGKIDIIIGSTSTTTKGLYVFRNTSSGAGSISFTRVDFAADNNLNNVAIGDLDGDGKAEIVASNGSGSVVSVYKNTSVPGSVLLTKTNFTANTAGSGGVAIGDVDGDGKSDILVADQNGQYLSVFRNTTTSATIDASSFAAKVDFDLGTIGFHYTVSLGDLDGDGKLDIVVPQGSANSVSVFRNTSTSGAINAGSLAARVDLSLTTTSFGAELADMDGDSKLDIVATASSKIAVFRNKATNGSLTTGSFVAGVEFAADAGSGSSPNAIAIGDINSDGKPDLVPSIPSSGFTFSVMKGTIGYVLPIHLLSLKAYQKAASIQIDWTMTSEEGIERYEVERSANGQQFAELGKVSAKGSNVLQTYNFLDATPLTGVSYYRLRMIGKSGEISYSAAVRLRTGNGLADMTIYPNPFTGNTFSLQLNAASAENYLLMVYDAIGRPVLRRVIEHSGGSAVETIALPQHLAKGVYQLTLIGKESTLTQKLTKE